MMCVRVCTVAKNFGKVAACSEFCGHASGRMRSRYEHVPTAGGNAGCATQDFEWEQGRDVVCAKKPASTHFFPSTSTPACLSNVRFQRFSSDSAGAVSEAMRAATPELSDAGAEDDEAAADILRACVLRAS